MQTSRFNLWLEDYPSKGSHILFNTRTQAIIKVNQELKQALDNLGCPPGAALTEHIDALRENGIIVESPAEEDAKIKDFFRQLKHESNAMSLEVTILTTYSCNFRCVYCFEESVRENVFMDQETSDMTVKWLIHRAEERGIKRIHLVYYGGEPLLNIKPIYDISWNMKQWAEKNGVEFGFGIITNGSLLNPELVDKFMTVGLKEVRVTIDGYREAHDAKRPFSNGRPSFDVIIDNIRGIIDRTGVSITGNFDRENYGSIIRLLDYLEEQGLLRKLNRILFSPIVPRLGPKDNPGAIELKECLSFLEKDGLFYETVNIKRELIRRGIKINTGLSVNACPLTMEDGGVTIDPRGAIYKCNSLLGYPEFSIGSVGCYGFSDRFNKYLNIDAWDKCPQDCPYIPMCQGGCRFFSYLENGDISGVCCKKEYFEKIVPELLKLEYDKMAK